MTELQHIPVLAEEVIQHLITDRSGTYLDGTCGLGGHSELILRELSEDGKLICIDRDVEMLEAAQNRLHDSRVEFHHLSYDEVGTVPAVRPGTLTGILLDLGICSAQLDDDNRGFSYQHDTQLDMRFDRSEGRTALEYLNSVSEEELISALRSHADFRNAAKYVRRVIDRRNEGRMRTVGDLVSCVEDLFPKRSKNQFTARFLQAVRIEVNDELGRLDNALPLLVNFLKPAGRLAVISYHSQEDRRVKRFFRRSSKDSGYPPEIEASMKGKHTALNSITRRAVKATARELSQNPRSRSARLRVAERSPAS